MPMGRSTSSTFQVALQCHYYIAGALEHRTAQGTTCIKPWQGKRPSLPKLVVCVGSVCKSSQLQPTQACQQTPTMILGHVQWLAVVHCINQLDHTGLASPRFGSQRDKGIEEHKRTIQREWACRDALAHTIGVNNGSKTIHWYECKYPTSLNPTNRPCGVSLMYLIPLNSYPMSQYRTILYPSVI